MKILLMGNPNVGKSVVFSRLTGANVVASNYPGTTVGYTRGTLKLKGKKIEVIDVPGTYSLTPFCKAEEVARDMFLKENPDLILNVLDSTNLERNLYLTLQILEKKVPTIIILNMWDLARRKGVHLNVKKLEESLGVPVIPVTAVSGEGIIQVIQSIEKILEKKEEHIPSIEKMDDEEKWKFIGKLLLDIQKIEHRHPTLLERLEDASVHPIFGILIALLVAYLTLQSIIGVGEFLIGNILDPFFYNYYGPLITRIIESTFPSGPIHDILIGTGYNYMESFGLLTTGVYVPLAVVLPYVSLFYLVLGFLEDLGYLPRLAVLTDNIMHKLGLHGASIISLILGLGCNVPGVLATRILEDERERFIALTLLSISVPCMAQTAVIIGLLGPYGIKYIAMVYGTLLTIYITAGYILNKIMKGESPEIFLEIPPYKIPHIGTLLKKTWIRIRGFLLEAIPFVFLGILAINLLYVMGIMKILTGLLAPIFSSILGLPREAAATLIIGFLRKDIATGLLAPLHLSPEQLVVATTVLAIYFPCIATFVVLAKEIGVKGMIKIGILMVTLAFLVGGIQHLILTNT
ncbi:MAG TPA: ferrous iron transporter B [Methanobacteriales archaeon]|nr:MAG: Small GTP-binding protein [Methanobacteriaceae archaeon 41_258]MBC7089862.1 ferrous iron transporter B [Methanobacteriaceae archaeon]MBC7096691.1 ferrous iron transporter B [Methanobacteriales archaeon]HIH61279.1 ferrous iron transporter B [Methanobacteriales archaeon]